MSAQPLTQQELLEKPPARRIIVPAGCRTHYGVDPSTKRVSIAGVLRAAHGGLDRWVRSVPFMPGDGAERLSGTYEATRRFAAELARMYPPGLVWVEQPSGRNMNLPLVYAVGVILAGICDGVNDAIGYRVAVETVPSSSWKLRACGNGAISKPTKQKLGRAVEFEDYAVARWARLNGYQGWLWDDADAMGVAEAARREVALVQR